MLAGIDLLTGQIIPLVEERHRSMDNHSIHTSKETMKYLSSRPWRFHFLFTPTHASWLNIIEMFFSKMSRSMLRGIRVDSKDELKNRMLEYIHEINNEPVIFTWKWKMDEMPGGITL